MGWGGEITYITSRKEAGAVAKSCHGEGQLPGLLPAGKRRVWETRAVWEEVGVALSRE